MASKLIDKMLPSATNHKVDVTVKKNGKATSCGKGGRGEGLNCNRQKVRKTIFPNILAKTEVKAREAINRLSSLRCGRSDKTVVLLDI